MRRWAIFPVVLLYIEFLARNAVDPPYWVGGLYGFLTAAVLLLGYIVWLALYIDRAAKAGV